MIKLSKLTTACKVYRGLKDAVLPPEFWSGRAGRGGVEYGFMSTTTSRDTAAGFKDGGGAATVFEFELGLFNRGANIKWLSQYPKENEILLAPLAGVEMEGSSVDGATLVVRLRLSVNLLSQTIERVIARRRHLLLEMRDSIESEVLLEMRARGIHDPRPIQWMRALSAVDGPLTKPPEHYNDDAQFEQAVHAVLQCKLAALRAAGDATQAGASIGRALLHLPMPTFREAYNRLPAEVKDPALFTEIEAKGQELSGSGMLPHGMSLDAAKALALYAHESSAPQQYYAALNRLLRELANPYNSGLSDFLPMLKLKIAAFGCLKPSDNILFRGVNTEFPPGQFQPGNEITWHALSSGTPNIGVVPAFIDHQGPSTIFIAQVRNAYDISMYSFYPQEDEVVTPPGIMLKVVSVGQLNNINLIYMKQIASPECPLNAAFVDTLGPGVMRE